MLQIPKIKLLQSINPSNSGTGDDVLNYQDLGPAVEGYKPSSRSRLATLRDTEPGSLEEISRARQVESEYLLKAAENAVIADGSDADVWADRFTKASTELFGEPDKNRVTHLLTDEYGIISQLVAREDVDQEQVQLLLDTYAPIVGTGMSIVDTDAYREKVAIREYGHAIRKQYGPLFGMVDATNKSDFNASDLKDLFTAMLQWLIDNDDPDWKTWQVVAKKGTSMSVSASKRTIDIASERQTASLDTTRGLIAHELLVHALRGKNGYKTGDKELATGLPGYLNAEEGLGILAEEAITGKLPDKVYDRYVDIALALGTVDGKERKRHELFKVSYARQLIRAQLRGEYDQSITTLTPRVWSHIDRIYRGGKGDEIGDRQAIFTKDIAYFVGYAEMARYISTQLAKGKSADEVFVYLSQAKFDPNNPLHLVRLTHPIVNTKIGVDA